MLNGRKPVGCISAVKLVGPVEVRGGLFQDVTLFGDAAVHAEDEAIAPSTSWAAKQRNTNRGSLPKHLPRIEELIEPDSTICGCGAERHVIGEDMSRVSTAE